MTTPTPTISFEFFPPKGPEGALRLWRSVERLAPLGPCFVSVTYGAGGSTRERTVAAIQTIRDRAGLDVAGHLTCVGATREETLAVARTYAKLGCRRIVALRGDPANGAERFTPHPGGFSGSVELIEALKAEGRFHVSVGAYPEPHPEAAGEGADVTHLKRKFDAGADDAITQFFFDVETFLRFRDRCAKAGIDRPIIPGVLPIENFARMKGFAARCGARVPAWMETAFANAEETGAGELLSISIAAEMCDTLRREGAGHIHLYTLNNPDLPYQVCQALGVETTPMRIAATGGCA
ncbi:MAG: methylenetetrahydrofolate reductase [NAD(P)H] [Pikeienuella sp.]|uniref:methylenetetrahydrofolate reductase [NAD(P)H] n=1 Tax=Pikeienuella sp. TaxID=2831957 RepID=UPI00391D1D24